MYENVKGQQPLASKAHVTFSSFTRHEFVVDNQSTTLENQLIENYCHQAKIALGVSANVKLYEKRTEPDRNLNWALVSMILGYWYQGIGDTWVWVSMILAFGC